MHSGIQHLQLPLPGELKQPVAHTVRHDQQRKVPDFGAVLEHSKPLSKRPLALLLLFGSRLPTAAAAAASRRSNGLQNLGIDESLRAQQVCGQQC